MKNIFDFKRAPRGMRPFLKIMNSMMSAMNQFGTNITGNIAAAPRFDLTATPQITNTVTLTTTFSLGSGVSSSVEGSAGAGSSASASSASNGSGGG